MSYKINVECNVMPPSKKCPECGTALDTDAPEGLCPLCLMRAAASSRAKADLPPGQTVPVSAALPAGSIPCNNPDQLPRFGDYEILGEIARGGMGIVYDARQISLNRGVALKMIASGQLAGDAEVRRFKTEAEAAAKLDHPNIVPVYEIGIQEGRHYFSMRRMDGGSLGEWQPEGGERNAAWLHRAAHLIAVVAHAVHYAHQRGILHRDIKPTNILLDAQGQPHLSDFGLAKLVEKDAGLTQSVAVFGSAHYMSPEQAAGRAKQLTTATDIYSLGAVLYELLTGQPPFQGDNFVETLRQVAEREPVRPGLLNSRVDRDLETITLKCLEKKPEQRYGSAEELALELERWQRHEPILARPSTSRERAGKWARRHPAIATLSALLVLITAIGFTGVVWQWKKAENALAQAREKTRAEMTARAPTLLPLLTLIHSGEVASVQFSRDGHRLLTAAEDKKARIWDAATGQLLTTFSGHTGVLSQALFSPDESRVLTVSFDAHTRFPWISPVGQKLLTTRSHRYGDQTVRIWETETGRPLLVLGGHTNQVSAAAFSPDGQRVVTASYDGTARIWDANNGAVLAQLTGHQAALNGCEFSPDGQRVLTSSDGYEYHFQWIVSGGAQGGSSSSQTKNEPYVARLYDAATGRELGGLRNQAGLLRSLADLASSHGRAHFSPDGRRIVTAAAYPGNVAIWDAASGRLLATLRGHDHEVIDAAFSPDGQTVVTASADGSARLWNAADGRQRFVLKAHRSSVLSVAFSPDGRRLLTTSADKTIRVWDPNTGIGLAVLKGHEGKVWSAVFSPDGLRIASASEDRTVRLWAAATLEQSSIELIGHRGPVNTLEFSPDGRRVATSSDDKTARVWDTESGKLLLILKGHAEMGNAAARDGVLGNVNEAVFSPDGKWIATAAEDRDALVKAGGFLNFGWGTPSKLPFHPARIWDAKTGQERFGLVGHATGVRLVRFSADGTRLLTASDGMIRTGTYYRHGGSSSSSSGSQKGSTSARVWDVKTGKQIVLLTGHTGPISSAAFSPDATEVATSDRRAVRVWDVASGQLLSTLDGASETPWVQFSPDGKRVLARRGGIEAGLWDAATGRPLALLRHDSEIIALHQSPAGDRIMTVVRQGNIRSWNPLRPEEPRMIKTGRNAEFARFNREGTLVAVVEEDDSIRLWDLEEEKPLARIRGHNGPVTFIAFSPDGRWLGTASQDYTARLWPLAVLRQGTGSNSGQGELP